MPPQEASNTTATPRVLLSAFADEAANRKTAVEQLSVLAAIGLRHYSPRFVDVEGTGAVKHVVDLDKNQFKTLKTLNAEYGLRVTSIGARLGKVKLRDEPDKSHNRFVPFAQYLDTELAATIRAAHELETKLIRGFSFYPPLGADPAPYVPQAVDQLGQIVDACAREGLVYGLEIEPNLVGSTGKLMATLARNVDRPNMVLIFDGGNVACQNKSPSTVSANTRRCGRTSAGCTSRITALTPAWSGRGRSMRSGCGISSRPTAAMRATSLCSRT